MSPKELEILGRLRTITFHDLGERAFEIALVLTGAMPVKTAMVTRLEVQRAPAGPHGSFNCVDLQKQATHGRTLALTFSVSDALEGRAFWEEMRARAEEWHAKGNVPLPGCRGAL